MVFLISIFSVKSALENPEGGHLMAVAGDDNLCVTHSFPLHNLLLLLFAYQAQ